MNDFVFLDSHWQALCERALDALRAFHTQQPDEPGIDRGRLRRMTAPTVTDAAWRALIDDLAASGSARAAQRTLAALFRNIGSRLSEREHRAGAEAAIRIWPPARFDPPWVRDLARQPCRRRKTR